MTETSFFWDGLITGDATLAPYRHGKYTDIWDILFTRTDNEGVIKTYENELEVTGAIGGIILATGAAIVDGWFYENDDNLTVAISTPVSDPRLDLIVIRMNFIDQEARVTVIEGTEAASPVPPALTQDDNVIWDIPLAQVTILTDATISVVDTRVWCHTPLGKQESWTLIEEIISIGDAFRVIFDDIPQTFRHLKVIGQWRGTDDDIMAGIFFNDDETISNYWRMTLNSDAGVVVPVGQNTTPQIKTDDPTFAADDAVGFEFVIQNYRGAFFANIIQTETTTPSITNGQPLASEGVVWLNTDPVEKIVLLPATGTILESSLVSLYGLT